MQNIKDDIKKSEISLVELLPLGAIGRLADKHGISRQNVTKMLSGEFGKPERLIPLVADAMFLIEEDQKERKAQYSSIKRKLKKKLEIQANVA